MKETYTKTSFRAVALADSKSVAIAHFLHSSGNFSDYGRMSSRKSRLVSSMRFGISVRSNSK
ncbi:hypothetical protein CLSA_c03120 [Clostridium saccharobutylicum DSM 13864]|uniref:Uncharacterized protein n=1 Tax=Clostridium saccharobutylicum DSM 13864 TaxID=1345695 RepID=U5MKN3_CLOSA|nr:hypothetical protein CLSA_c03120 [Clostridium saccharobutylicum DSM 13864]